MFGNVDRSKMEDTGDTLGGGGFQPKESNIYLADVKVMYVTESQAGAKAVNVELELEDGSNYRETIYVTNRIGEVTFEKDGKVFPLPGFKLIDEMCLIASGKDLTEQDFQPKTLKLYDFESRSEVPREVPVSMDTVGQKIAVAIQQIRENKQVKGDDGKYRPTNEERVINSIVAVFHPEQKVTVTEARAEKEPAFWDAWLKRWEGKVNDKYKEVAQTGGMRTANTGSAPAKRNSLFAKK